MNTSTDGLLVVGDCMLDRYWEGAVDRISPEAPVPVLRVQRQFDRPGGAANVAINLAGLGHQVTLVTLLGDDNAGQRLAGMLSSHGVQVAALRDEGFTTTQKIRPVCRRQQLLRIDFEDVPEADVVQRLSDAARPLLARHAWALLCDYAKGSLRDSAALIAHAAAHGCRVLVDPKGRDFTRYRGAHVLKPNAAEVRAVVGDWHDEADFLCRAQALRTSLEVEHLLVTRGELGMTLCSRGRPARHVPARAREVYDVTGAGDTVLAALAHALASGQPIDAAVRTANVAAGIVVGKFGTATLTLAELRAATATATAEAGLAA